MRFKKILIWVLVFLLIMPNVAFGATTYTLSQAKKDAVAYSSDIKMVSLERVQKEIEIKQAREAIADIRKKESTIRFSLLINIEFPSSHDMPTEIDLLTKLPDLQNELTVLQEKEVYQTLKVETDTETAYYNVLQEENNYADISNQLAEAKVSLASMETQEKLGKATSDDVKYLSDKVSSLETAKQQSATNLDVKIKNLGNLAGKELRYGYTFQEYFPEITLTRTQLTEMTNYALDNNFTVYEAVEARKIAQTDADIILQIYKSQYGGYISDIESYIKSTPAGSINYDYFLEKYNHTLTAIEAPWQRVFTINLFFFKISIPYEWFKGEYSGLRYMDDEKYALFVALAERDKALFAEEQAKEQLENSIYTEYSTLKQMESAMDLAETSLAEQEEAYEQRIIDNKMGLVSFTDLESDKEQFYASQTAAYDAKMEYGKTLSALNLSTGGYINHLLSGGSMSTTTLDSGVSVMGEAAWYLDDDLTEYSFAFGVNIPDTYGVDTYQLSYEGSNIGEKTSIDEELIHLHLTYGDTSLMTVDFYNGSERKYTSTFIAEEVQGVFDMVRVEGSSDTVAVADDAVGSYSIAVADTLRSDFAISDVTLNYDSYEVFVDTTSIGSGKKDAAIRTLSLYYSDQDKITVVLYNGGAMVATLYLENNQLKEVV